MVQMIAPRSWSRTDHDLALPHGRTRARRGRCSLSSSSSSSSSRERASFEARTDRFLHYDSRRSWCWGELDFEGEGRRGRGGFDGRKSEGKDRGCLGVCSRASVRGLRRRRVPYEGPGLIPCFSSSTVGRAREAEVGEEGGGRCCGTRGRWVG